MSNSRPNPYVGPRSFRTGEKMYGRERETLELLDLVIAERIVLLYSPSGAGKTSLIQAALVPKLQEEGFNVTRPIRVSSEPPVLPPPPGANPERAATTSVTVSCFRLCCRSKNRCLKHNACRLQLLQV